VTGSCRIPRDRVSGLRREDPSSSRPRRRRGAKRLLPAEGVARVKGPRPRTSRDRRVGSRVGGRACLRPDALRKPSVRREIARDRRLDRRRLPRATPDESRRRLPAERSLLLVVRRRRPAAVTARRFASWKLEGSGDAPRRRRRSEASFRTPGRIGILDRPGFRPVGPHRRPPRPLRTSADAGALELAMTIYGRSLHLRASSEPARRKGLYVLAGGERPVARRPRDGAQPCRRPQRRHRGPRWARSSRNDTDGATEPTTRRWTAPGASSSA